MKVYKFSSRNLILLAVGLNLLILMGCASSRHPINRIIPTLSFSQRIQNCEQNCKKELERSEEKYQGIDWINIFYRELNEMDGWAPPIEWFDQAPKEVLKKEIAKVAGEYGLLDLPDNYYEKIIQELPKAASYFVKKTSKGYVPREGSANLEHYARGMLYRIDDEHQTLLDKKYPYPEPSDENDPLPRMVSKIYPVGVSLAVIYPKEETKAKETLPPQIIINEIAETSPTEAIKPEKPSVYQIMINDISAKKATETTKVTEESLILPVIDFQPVQNITLSLSTVLNSADTSDRLDYVSTFLYVYPYPKPPNGNINLNDQFWRHFFSSQVGRIKGRGQHEKLLQEAMDAIRMDIRHSFDTMSIRFRDIQTTVTPTNLDLGKITRGTTDSIGGGVSASIPASVASISPSLTFASGVTSSTETKLLRQLDQRSAFISPEANFLRITQRGMINANLGGRFNEKVQLYVPPAEENIIAIVPKLNKKKEGNNNPGYGFSIKSLSQPLYSRVDAMVVSMAVVRHPTKLRKTKDENFGLPNLDVADTDFIVGLPSPNRITLWTWDRKLVGVLTSDLVPNIKRENNENIYFDSESSGIYDANPLLLAGFSDTLTSALLVKISNAILKRTGKASDKGGIDVNIEQCKSKSCKYGSYYILLKDKDTNTTIRLGLLDYQSKEKPKLKPFNKNNPS